MRSEGLVCIAFALFVLGPFAQSAAGFDWAVQTIDAKGYYFSIAVDSQGVPHVNYCKKYGDHDYGVRYANWNGTTWDNYPVTGLGDVVTHGTSLALDERDYPHMSYNSAGGLEYASWDGSSWQFATVEKGDGSYWFSSLALDGASRPQVSYYDNSSLEGKYAEWDGVSWNVEVVGSTGIWGFMPTSLALDAGGSPHLVGFQNSGLTYAVREVTGWTVQKYISRGGHDASMVLDADGYPHIAHHVINEDILLYTYWDGLGWVTETVDGSGDVNGSVSLALDHQGQARISYALFDEGRTGRGYLRQALYNGTAWEIEDVPVGIIYPGNGTSLAIDPDGNSLILYTHKAEGTGFEELLCVVGIPEPATLSILAAGMGAVWMGKRRGTKGLRDKGTK